MTEGATGNRAGTLETGLDVIELLAGAGTALGVSEIAGRLSLDRGNTHRLLKVLKARGYIAQDAESKRYRPTAHLIGVAGAILRDLDLRTAAQQACDSLVAATGESVHAAQVTSDGIVYVLQRRGPHRVSVNTDVGDRAPLHATATGKAVLAFLPEDRVRSLVSEPLTRYTSRTHGTLDDLTRDLSTVRQRGFAVDDEELNPDVRCIAAPVFDINGDIFGSIGVSGPTQRIGVNQVIAIADRVLEAATLATRALGGPVERLSQLQSPLLEASTTAEIDLR
ncbi:IclR family transcriptional regulator [Microbacterium sp. 10M-3C3]|jgi:IclR family acetate operon transcriptional repressor|uniref:IclR family transcriptional regulator n=1 Tax=Microbacterium sp. 10M-3C3 TaxID=2483401 RepID=UPI000F63C7E9|nr:IclR family transcriptional regulator [Microbacterium sp. 10M-3C3]